EDRLPQMQMENPEERAGQGRTSDLRRHAGGERGGVDPPLAQPSGRWQLVVFLAALAVLLGSFFCQWRASAPSIREAVLRGEEGPVEGRTWTVRPGVRLRLELTLARPVSLVVFLQDCRGGFSEVYPVAGDAPVLRGPRLRLPENDSWDTAGLDRGDHCL